MEILQRLRPFGRNLTIFLNSSVAYDTQADWIDADPDYAMRFRDGDGLTDDTRHLRRSWSGLCRIFLRKLPPQCWAHETGVMERWRQLRRRGSGSYGFSSMLVYISHKNGAFFQNYGRVLRDQAIYGVKPEGKLNVKWHYEKGHSPTESPTNCAIPNTSISEWYADSIAPEDLFCTVRIPLRHVGMGPMMAHRPPRNRTTGCEEQLPGIRYQRTRQLYHGKRETAIRD